MVDTEPLKKYIESRDALKAGDKQKALTLLAESMGCEEPTEYMKTELEKLVEPNVATLTLIIHESKGSING
ncbi:hypothetical protein LCGC14_1645200 [marine sediment metagenome]|uniref:Uncharacterized protein n=1 Tax=marine sediment metagenome TaxID=412755 RepID=A0A0F9KE99_9ZZZZ